jgi:methyl-accepting chemotaxis protein
MGLLLVLFIPFRIVGPLYRVEQDLKQIGLGNLDKSIRLRSGDILKEHAEAVNTAMDGLGSIVKDIKKSGSSLETRIRETNPEEIRSAWESHKKQLDRLITKP